MPSGDEARGKCHVTRSYAAYVRMLSTVVNNFIIAHEPRARHRFSPNRIAGYGSNSIRSSFEEDQIDTQSSVEFGLLLAPRTATVRSWYTVHRNVTKSTWVCEDVW